LRAVVGSEIARSTVCTHELGKDLDDSTGANAAGHVDRQTFACVLIDHGQALQLLPIGAGVEHEIVGPHLIGAERRDGPRPARRNTSPWPFFRYLKAVLPPNPMGSIRTHRVAAA